VAAVPSGTNWNPPSTIIIIKRKPKLGLQDDSKEDLPENEV
jgi:hypothetical protein